MTEEQENELKGLGGWLILVGIGIVFSPVKIIISLYPLYSSIFSDGTWELLTTPGSEFYNALWLPILGAEIVLNAALVLGWLGIAWRFFSKKQVFRIWYIGILLFTIAFQFADAFAIAAVLPDEEVFDPETLKEIIRSLVYAAIWIPYVLISERVKATFVN